MNRQELAEAISNETDLPVTTVDSVIGAMIKVVTLTVKVGEEVNIRTFGRFVPRDRVATTKMNPRTGESHRIPKRRSIVFLPTGSMKGRLNGRRRRTSTRS